MAKLFVSTLFYNFALLLQKQGTCIYFMHLFLQPVSQSFSLFSWFSVKLNNFPCISSRDQFAQIITAKCYVF